MSDATTLLSRKCYPDTKSLREGVAQMHHQMRTSYFRLGWNYFVRQGVSYTIFSTKVAMFLLVTVDPEILGWKFSSTVATVAYCSQHPILRISGYHIMHVFDTRAEPAYALYF